MIEEDIIKIIFDDGSEHKLSDISQNKFDEFMFKSGMNDIEFKKYKRENGMVDLTDFNSQSTNEITLVVENESRERTLKFRCIYDSDNDEH